MHKLTACLAIQERHGHWAAKVRQHFDIEPLVETRIWDDLFATLSERPHSIALLELQERNFESTLRNAIKIRREFNQCRFIFAGDSFLEPIRWQLSEFGATCTIHNFSSFQEALAVVRKHLKLAPALELDFPDSIWQRLPWQSNAS